MGTSEKKLERTRAGLANWKSGGCISHIERLSVLLICDERISNAVFQDVFSTFNVTMATNFDVLFVNKKLRIMFTANGHKMIQSFCFVFSSNLN